MRDSILNRFSKVDYLDSSSGGRWSRLCISRHHAWPGISEFKKVHPVSAFVDSV